MIRSNGWIALILIVEDDPRMNKFVQLRAGDFWARTCHPAYTANETLVGLEDIVLVHYQHLPCTLVNTMVHSDIVLLLTNEEIITNRKRYKESHEGIASQERYEENPEGIATQGKNVKALENCYPEKI